MVKKDMNVLIAGYNRSANRAELINVDENGALVSAIGVPEGAPVVGQSQIAETGVAIQLSGTDIALPGGIVLVRCDPNNGDPVVVGGAAVTDAVDGTGNGTIVSPGEIMAVFAANLSDVYVNGVAGSVFSWSAG